MQGHCRCRQVQFEVTANPLVTMVCHWTGCQRMTGSAYSLSALYRSDQFRLIQGEPVIGGLHGATRHSLHRDLYRGNAAVGENGGRPQLPEIPATRAIPRIDRGVCEAKRISQMKRRSNASAKVVA